MSEIPLRMYIGFQVKYRYSCQILMKVIFSVEIFENYSSVIFHEKLSSGRQVVAYGRTDMTQLIVALRNFAKAPKNC